MNEEQTEGAELVKAAKNMDWQQVVLNGGPPCFCLEDDGRFCGRTERWEGHGIIHEYLPLHKLLSKLALHYERTN